VTKQFQVPALATAGLASTLGHEPQLATLGRECGDQAICLTKIGSPEDNRFGSVQPFPG
jgi:hypothetical protein